jgi:hypothetical protein
MRPNTDLARFSIAVWGLGGHVRSILR